MLLLYNERAASPSELAERLGASLGDVSYHTKRLLELGCIELDRIEPSRGAPRHYYRAVLGYDLENHEYAGLPPDMRGSFVDPILTTLWNDVAQARRVGGLSDADVHISHQRLELDAAGWEALSALLRELVETAARLSEESAKRRAHGPIRTATLGVIHVRTER